MGRPKSSNKPKRKQNQLVETLQSLDFGMKNNQCYRAALITIAGEPYCGLIKCWRPPGYADYHYTRTRLFMPLAAWNSFVTDIVPQINYAHPSQRQDVTDQYAIISNFYQSPYHFHQSQYFNTI